MLYMNIKQAKEEIKNTFLAYTRKRTSGEFCVPLAAQRPILLIGPPGIGKTAIVAQVAQELKTGFLSYTMTHHTRQSAIGLPLIKEKKFGEKQYAITEYTMSEIIGAVYEQMEQTGCKEGILFLDEINCVSETLAPTMLQFLQYKMFGTHHLPEGWLIVTASNPPMYNKSVREFDLVTLDRIKRIDITEDYDVWKEYAISRIHSVILSYLDLKKDAFYKIERNMTGMVFVTARGWEDLSIVLSVYEEMGIEITKEFLTEYIQFPELAADFKNYYDLYKKYRDYYHIEEIVMGHFEKEQVERLRNAPFDEAVCVIHLFLSKLQEGFSQAFLEDGITKELHKLLQAWKIKALQARNGIEALQDLKEVFSILETRWKQGKENRIFSGFQDSKEEEILSFARQICMNYQDILSKEANLSKITGEESFEIIKKNFSLQIEKRKKSVSLVKAQLDTSFDFLEEAFHSSQEMVIFITELSSRKEAVWFIMENGCDKFYQYNEDLLFYEKEKALRTEISKLGEELTLDFLEN